MVLTRPKQGRHAAIAANEALWARADGLGVCDPHHRLLKRLRVSHLFFYCVESVELEREERTVGSWGLYGVEVLRHLGCRTGF